MATLAAALQRAKVDHILQQPTDLASKSTANVDAALSAAASTTLTVALVNNTGSSNAYAYVNGLAGGNNDAVYLLESDGKTVYYPTSPSSNGSALAVDCAIPLGAPGSTTTITVPLTDGGRIWFSRDATLTFLLNEGPALVEPSPTNTADPNYNIYWDFCEFTFNTSQLYVNITCVDFVCLPIGLSLENTSGTVTTVEGLPADGLDTVCSELTAQTASDGQGWSDLIVTLNGANLRALSPNNGIVMNSSLFDGYYDPYVTEVWDKYSNGAVLTIDTQTSTYGSLNGTVENDVLTFSGVGTFSQPSSADIFSNSTGPFAQSGAEIEAIIPRLAAAFVRSTLLIDAVQPDDEVVSTYYTNTITDHYARICHATELDGKGYAFPYDDVTPTGGADQSGYLSDPNPSVLTVTVGGPSTTSTVKLRDMATRVAQRPGGRQQAQHQRVPRDAGWLFPEDEKKMLAGSESDASSNDNNDGSDGGAASDEGYNSASVDLEKGLGRGKHDAFCKGVGGGFQDAQDVAVGAVSSSSFMTRPLTSLVPPGWGERVTSLLERLEASPVYARTRPLVDLVVRLLTLFLSMSVRALVSRVTMALFLVLFYLVMPMLSRNHAGAGVHVAPVAQFLGVDPVNITEVVTSLS
ncbi:family 64 glycoside hydrolase [Cryphonectria parasitica EP155]|uniref:Family 64 glycoside hydrolase n=1 Tax=Cryphonectria parasitica (strain ATCC 38755 / EP155) TaxID=660469 RepID=A0A9P4YBP5_CRYP1|nr:family 64 glycoside hydrolase [Cryphonectria parasitica EP155]KAF3770431.1 family 64 glycoside hydrolase [Cryphonectria parasitica EP155]